MTIHFLTKTTQKCANFVHILLVIRFFDYFSLIFQIFTVQWLNCTNLKYERNRSYNGGGVVYVLKVRHLDQHDSTIRYICNTQHLNVICYISYFDIFPFFKAILPLRRVYAIILISLHRTAGPSRCLLFVIFNTVMLIEMPHFQYIYYSSTIIRAILLIFHICTV